MTRIIAISIGKGGVLKSSITTNMAGLLSKQKKKVLIIDTDHQGNSALSFGKNPDLFENTTYDVLVEGLDPKKAITKVHKNIDLLPANDDMEFVEMDILTNISRYKQPFHLLKRAMEKVADQYDYVLIDTPPSLGLVQSNVLTFAEEVLIPFQPEPFAMRSLKKMLKAIQRIKDTNNVYLNVLGVVGTLVDTRTNLHSEVLQECRAFCKMNNIPMYQTVIPRTIGYASSVAYKRLPATLVRKKADDKEAYYNLLKEMNL